MVMYYRALYAAPDSPVYYFEIDSFLRGGRHVPECLWIRWSDPFENQVGCQHFDLTTGEVKTVIPTAKNMSIVFGKDGVETEIQVGQMRQTLGKQGFGRLFYKR